MRFTGEDMSQKRTHFRFRASRMLSVSDLPPMSVPSGVNFSVSPDALRPGDLLAAVIRPPALPYPYRGL